MQFRLQGFQILTSFFPSVWPCKSTFPTLEPTFLYGRGRDREEISRVNVRWNIKREMRTVPNREEAAEVREERERVNEKTRATSCPMALCDKDIMEIEMLHAGWKQQRMLQHFSNKSHDTVRQISDPTLKSSEHKTGFCLTSASAGWAPSHRSQRSAPIIYKVSPKYLHYCPLPLPVGNRAFEVLRR